MVPDTVDPRARTGAQAQPTYEAACTAYYAAYTIYCEEYSTLQDQWETFENTLFVDAQLTIYGVLA